MKTAFDTAVESDLARVAARYCDESYGEPELDDDADDSDADSD
jgi:hypothetical protein